jgi:RNA polymerase sigma-70 factor (ECF subfamily)
MERMIEADKSLVERAQLGDRAAFEELVRRCSRLVYARLYLEVGDSHHAEDLLQETLLTAFRTISQLTQTDKFRPWLLRIAQNAAIDAARKNNRKKRTPEFDDLKLRQDALVVLRPDEEAEKTEMKQKVLAILRTLPEEYRLPLTLRFLVGADYESIQAQMGLTNGSLRGLLHRGVAKLREQLQKELGEDFV